ncbi:unnamed protein product [Acanthosepion pharaonis]|uniref:Uncharacterized protein n=1 Tax=Acanthosepion pharaonis TaxID=158019 RepID=A0A812DMQ6_ACAPH|nr:unnamed protein product [Sepia pharaonis]
MQNFRYAKRSRFLYTVAGNCRKIRSGNTMMWGQSCPIVYGSSRSRSFLYSSALFLPFLSLKFSLLFFFNSFIPPSFSINCHSHYVNVKTYAPPSSLFSIVINSLLNISFPSFAFFLFFLPPHSVYLIYFLSFHTCRRPPPSPLSPLSLSLSHTLSLSIYLSPSLFPFLSAILPPHYILVATNAISVSSSLLFPSLYRKHIDSLRLPFSLSPPLSLSLSLSFSLSPLSICLFSLSPSLCLFLFLFLFLFLSLSLSFALSLSLLLSLCFAQREKQRN